MKAVQQVVIFFPYAFRTQWKGKNLQLIYHITTFKMDP